MYIDKYDDNIAMCYFGIGFKMSTERWNISCVLIIVMSMVTTACFMAVYVYGCHSYILWV